jgi:hypothetical protein
MSNPIKLPTGYAGFENSPELKEELKNFIVMPSQAGPILSLRPGVEYLLDGFGKCRAMGEFRNNLTGDMELYTVSGKRFCRIRINDISSFKNLKGNEVVLEDIGEITGSSKLILLGGFTKLLIMEVGGRAWVYDQVNGINLITDPNYLRSSSVAYDDEKFIFVPTDGSPFFWSKLGDPGSIDPSSWADAEKFPDPNKAVFTLKSSICVLGSASTQRLNYEPTANVYLTYQGTESNVGYAGGLTDYGETYAWVGMSAGGSFSFYAMAEQPQRISDDSIDELINREYSLREVSNTRAQSADIDGTKVLIFYFPRHTIVYYGGWGFWQTGSSGLNVDTWNISHLQKAYGFVFTGDSKGPQIGYLKDTGRDYGDHIEYGVKTYMTAPPNTTIDIKFLYCRATMGNSESENQIGRLLSKGGRIFSPSASYKSLGVKGDYNRGVRWGSPVIKHDGHIGIYITGQVDSPINISALSYDGTIS